MRKRKIRIERRKAQRLPIRMKLKYRTLEKKEWKEATCENISGIGVGIYIAEPLNVNDRIKVLLHLKEDPKPIEIVCRITWCMEMARGRYKAGLEVTKVADPTRFIEFICNRLIEPCLQGGISIEKEQR